MRKQSPRHRTRGVRLAVATAFLVVFFAVVVFLPLSVSGAGADQTARTDRGLTADWSLAHDSTNTEVSHSSPAARDLLAAKDGDDEDEGGKKGGKKKGGDGEKDAS